MVNVVRLDGGLVVSLLMGVDEKADLLVTILDGDREGR